MKGRDKLDRAAWETYIVQTYSAEKDNPWIRFPKYTVFRHVNQKWFAVIMEVPRSKLGLQGNDSLEVINLKCQPALIGSLRGETGIFPAYHMNKEHWITVTLDGSVPTETIQMLLDMSFEATASKRKKTD